VSEPLVQAAVNLTSFGEDADGELYLTSGNQISRLVSDSPPPPVVPASSRRGSVALAALLALAGGARLATRRARRS
jgi:hypothetical protein